MSKPVRFLLWTGSNKRQSLNEEHTFGAGTQAGRKPMCALRPSVVSDSVIPWTVAHQAPPSMEFYQQEFWSGLSFSTPGDVPDSVSSLWCLLHW